MGCGENEECNFLTAGKSNLGSLWKCAHSQFGMLALRPDSILSSFIFCHSFFYLFIHPFIHYLSAVLNKSVGNDENDDDNDDDDDDDKDDGGGNVYRGCDVSPAGLAPREQPIIIQMLPSLYHGLLLATSYNTSSIILRILT